MKHVQTLLYSFVLLLSLFSCNHGTIYEKLPLLTEIQLLGDTLPTQALLKLDSIKPFFNNESEYMRNKLALLNIRLHERRLYFTQVTASLNRCAVILRRTAQQLNCRRLIIIWAVSIGI